MRSYFAPPSNTRACFGSSGLPGDALAVTDELHPIVRRALHDGVASWDAVKVREIMKFFQSGGCEEVEAATLAAKVVRGWDDIEIDTFNAKWVSIFGAETPHVAAGASVVRYDSRRKKDRRYA